ncbi:Dystrotelin [Takifugu flavidus]|uniref:Dystrotelin n=1 Tax=Takifugu flavidus TaxID=433684 RepID=A0A5C6NA89_9TELE|nr:Dystrotelin [Takifugu flavidus]
MDQLDDIRSSVYRVSMKLLRLQNLCQMDVVFLGHITAAFVQEGGANLMFDREEVAQTLSTMFHNVSQEVPGQLTAVEQMCTLVFQLFDRTGTNSVSADSVQTLLIVLSAETLPVKYTALVDLSGNGSGSISRSGLTSLLDHLNQIPAAVQETDVFGDVDAAVLTCFNGVWSPVVSKEHVLSWLRSEPPLLLWLPTLYRLFISQSISHSVRCHICKTTPITGLRYRCMRCVNVHVCQSCFLRDKHTRKHKLHHPVLEFCTQPTWRESLLSLVHSTRHALLPHEYAQRRTERIVSSSFKRDISHDATFSSKGLQTEKPQHEQVMTLLNDVRTLQRDKQLLKQQLHDWRRAIQSEQSVLEDKYSGMEVSMETLRKHNMCLQDMLAQVNSLSLLDTANHALLSQQPTPTKALDKMEAGQHMSQPVSMETEKTSTPICDTEACPDSEGDVQVITKKDEVESEEEQFPTMLSDTVSSHDVQCEEGVDSEGEPPFCHQTDDSGDEGTPEDSVSWSGEDCGASSPERKLQESVERLKTLMETDMWRERRAGGLQSALHN